MTPTPPTATPEALQAALAAVTPIVTAVPADAWHRPTPCESWDVRELLNHIVMGNRLYAAAIRGDGDITGLRARFAGDQLGADPVAAWRETAADVAAAFAEPGALEGTATVMFGTIPARDALHLRICETLVHGWDLARATGQPDPAVADEVVHAELVFTAPMLERVPAERKAFAAARPTGSGRPALDRLAALMGRDPSWTAV